MIETLKEWWFLVASGLGTVAWFFRLEARGLANEKAIKDMQTQRHEDLAAAKTARDETNEMLREMRTDIKSLLRGSAK